ncbi:hypothetical protein IMCC21906_00061 [Spongiibacter sp. IMCC21906]|uniref:hypothetical protein n=1 Tax=Spongiibacter sp. IMCC21906 TaxID=1620392 RepID=UPI00062DE89B|nr:hypothetical protein [Spongiibacter sp. IMCC21906]AKH67756.1 hypothetical protein IMCC21906_00061 [Spongiibacter sp. IMCC21906]
MNKEDMINKETYIAEVEQRLRRMFKASRDGHKAAPVERHRLEGFMQAGVFLGLASHQELGQKMAAIHYAVFGKTIEERKAELSGLWKDEAIDYSAYDAPTYERKGH